MSSYVPLWCKSNFSFLEGASHPDELVEEAYRLGMPALALTDRDGVYGVVHAHVKARELGLRLILGSQVTVEDGSIIVLLAEDHRGYTNLCRVLTAGRLRSEKGESVVSWNEVCDRANGLIALWGGEGSLIVAESDSNNIAGNLRDAFNDRIYGMIARHRREDEVEQERRLRRRAKHYGFELIAANEVLYHTPARRPLQDVLTAIRHSIPVNSCGRKLKPNAEHGLKSPYAIERLFADEPAALNRTLEVSERCAFSLNEIRYRYPSEAMPDGTTSADWLRHLTFEGAKRRYPQGIPPPVEDQLNKELGIINALDYPGYFLTMQEIVEFCRDRGILCQGRGSAANSAVCYCLGVTAIDPVRMGLLFERFISKERAEPPDIDLELWRQSLNRIAEWTPHTLFLTHFGPSAPAAPHLASFAENLEFAAGLVRRSLEKDGSLALAEKHLGHPDTVVSYRAVEIVDASAKPALDLEIVVPAQDMEAPPPNARSRGNLDGSGASGAASQSS